MQPLIEVRSTRCDPTAFEAALRIRYEGYYAMRHIEARADRRFPDGQDGAAGAETLLATLGREPVGTLRILRRPAGAPLASLLASQSFPEELLAQVGNASSIEVGRFAIDPAHLGPLHLKVKLALLKAALATCLSEGFERCVATARQEHVAFYTRQLGMRACGAPAVYPGLRCMMTLLVGDPRSLDGVDNPVVAALRPTPQQLDRWVARRKLQW